MMKKAKDLLLRIVAIANIIVLVLMMLCGYSDRLDPVAHPLLANAGLAFPVFLCLNLAFLVFWVFFRLRWTVIPVCGLVLCFQPVRTYSPLNVSSATPEGSIKVISYNVWNLASKAEPEGSGEIAAWLVRQDADIVCMQEFSGATPENRQRFFASMKSVYPYSETTFFGGNDELAIFTKHPVLAVERIPFVSNSNQGTAFRLLMGSDTVTVMCCHLESIAFTNEEKSQLQTIVKGDMQRDSAQTTSRRLTDKLVAASRRRAPQADSVAQYIRRLNNRNVILCGDFNDSPISYVHRTIARELTDCYVSTANGPGISYRDRAFPVRIDNIFCSSNWTPYDCHIDKSITASDHYPIVCYLKKNE